MSRHFFSRGKSLCLIRCIHDYNSSIRLYVTPSGHHRQQCWFGCSCRCHAATTVEVVFDNKEVFGVKEGLNPVLAGAPPTGTATFPEPGVSSTPSENLEQSVVSEATPLRQRSPAARNYLQESRDHGRARADSYRGNRRHALGADASGDSSAADGNPSVAQALELNHPEGGSMDSPQKASAHLSQSGSGGSSGTVSDVRRRGRRDERRGFLEMPSKPAAAAAITEGVGSGGGTCCLCSATCWFACACVCHTATDVSACCVSEAGDASSSSALAPHAVEAVVINGVARPLLASAVDTPDDHDDDDYDCSVVGVGEKRQAQLRQGNEGLPWVSGTSGNPVGSSELLRESSGTPGSPEAAEARAPPAVVVVLAASEGAAAVATTDPGKEKIAIRARTAMAEQGPRREGREPSAARARTAGGHTPGGHTPRESTPREHTPGGHIPDVQSAFLATSEGGGGGARAIHFGTAARLHSSAGQDGGGPSAGARKGEACEGTGDTRCVTTQTSRFCR